MNGEDWNQGYHAGRTGGVDSTSYGGQADAGYAQGRKEWLASIAYKPPDPGPIVPLPLYPSSSYPLRGGSIKAFWVWVFAIVFIAAMGLVVFVCMASHSAQSRSDQWLERQHAQRDQFNRDHPALAKKFADMRNRGTQIRRNPNHQLQPKPVPAQSAPPNQP